MDRIEDLKDIVKVQCRDGNWNYGPYMFGMANGLICALAVLENIEPKYLTAPDKWLCDQQPKRGIGTGNG